MSDPEHVIIESVTVYEFITLCPLCGHKLPASAWPTDCPLCSAPHKICGGCGGHIRWGGATA